jgi:hypothetical protein
MLRALLFGFALLPTALQAQTVRTFEDWSVFCSVAGHCTAFGFVPNKFYEAPAFLQLQRGADKDAAVKAWIGVSHTEERDVRIHLTLDGKAAREFLPKTLPLAKDQHRIPLAPTPAFIRALSHGKTIEVDGDVGPTEISLVGATTALRWMDDQQGRVGTHSALIAKTGTNRPRIEPPRPVLRKPAAITPFDQRPATPPALLKILEDKIEADQCSPLVEIEELPIKAMRLSETKTLWSGLCIMGAYNWTWLLYIEENGNLTPAHFPLPDFDDATPPLFHSIDIEGTGKPPSNLLVLSEGGGLDPVNRTVSMGGFGRGTGECGGMADWIWDGVEFRLTSYRTMPRCQGVGSDYWPDLMVR